MKVILPNGLTLEGTDDQVRAYLKDQGISFNPTVWYFSESRGMYVPIKEMDTSHLRNAILKMVREWNDNLIHVEEPAELCKAIRDGVRNDSFVAMLQEYYTRAKP